MIIDVKNVSIEYKIPKGKKIVALNNVSYSINEGEAIGLIGLNGAGKSSTIKLLTGIIRPSQGEIVVMGQNPFKKRKMVCRKYGVMFGQRSQLWWDLPVIDSFYVNGSIYGLSKRQVDKRIEDYQEWLDLNYLDVPVRKLSLGQRIMCDILVSMLHKPEILFLDEATIALDVINRRKILDMISIINKKLKTTIIITSHQLDDIETVCERIILLDHGNVIYDGALTDFLSNSKYSKVINCKIKDVELFKKEIKMLENKYGVRCLYKGTESCLCFENIEGIYNELIIHISNYASVDTFVIRRITLEERLLLMEG